jgi:N-methylhydantoinase B
VTIDPLTLAVVSNALIAVAEETGWVLRRTSYSEAVREGEDLSASVFNAEGEMIGQGNYAPGHLGTSPTAVAAVVRKYPKHTMRPGDAFLLNDPTMNSGHLNDIYSIAPAFHDNEVVGFSVVTAHHVDVGGAAPGSQAIVGIVDVHQEGIRILPVRHFREGERQAEILELIAANVRIPEQVMGDLIGQYNANMVGVEGIRKLIDKVGLETFRAGTQELLDRSEVAMRSAIAELPDGTYEFTDYMDDCGPDTGPIRAHLTVTIAGDRLSADYTGSSPSTRSGVNCYFPFTRAYTYHALKSIVAPRLPQNSGCMRAIAVSAPPGSFFNAIYPTPSGGRAVCVRFIVDTVNGAMAKVVPDRVPAASSQLCNSTFGGVNEKSGRPFVYYDLTFGSTGARPNKDACDGLVSGFNTANIPIEIHESIWPIKVDQFGYVTDTCGPGKYRGGMAVKRDVRNLAGITRLTNLHDRHVAVTWGLAGGQPGSLGRILLNPDQPNEEELHSKSIRDIHHNDVVSFRTCGGGGWGDPLERNPDAVLDDVLEGFVSHAAAAKLYGVALSESRNPTVLGPQTAELRLKLKAHPQAADSIQT